MSPHPLRVPGALLHSYSVLISIWRTVKPVMFIFFFLNDPAPTEFYPLPLPAPLPICAVAAAPARRDGRDAFALERAQQPVLALGDPRWQLLQREEPAAELDEAHDVTTDAALDEIGRAHV